MAAQKITVNGKDLTVYQFFELDEKASSGDLKSAYRRLCLKHHPDRCPEKQDLYKRNFQVVQAAWALISTPQARQRYDHGLATERGQRGPREGFVVVNFSGWGAFYNQTSSTVSAGGW